MLQVQEHNRGECMYRAIDDDAWLARAGVKDKPEQQQEVSVSVSFFGGVDGAEKHTGLPSEDNTR